MSGRKRFAVIGEDARQAAAGRALARAGFEVGGPEQIAQADYLLRSVKRTTCRAWQTLIPRFFISASR